MAGIERVTRPLLNILDVFLDAYAQDAELHGYGIAKQTKHSGPTVYGVLDRLEDAGWIVGHWEDEHPDGNKPRRMLWRLTSSGVTEARQLLAERRARRPVRSGRTVLGTIADFGKRPRWGNAT